MHDRRTAHPALSGHRRHDRIRPGTAVEVRSTFNDSWVRGFRVAASLDEGYRLLRESDGSILPAVLAAGDVRPET